MYRDYYGIEFTDVIGVLEGGVVETDFNLTQVTADVPCTLSGVVVSSSGGIVGVTVGLFDSEDRLVMRELTQDAGTYEMSNIEAGVYTLVAYIDGYRISTSKVLNLISGHTDVEDIYLYANSNVPAIYGILRDESGQPLAGKRITLSEFSRVVHEMVTASDGEYLFTTDITGTAPKTYVLDLDDRYYALESSITIEVIKDQDYNYDLTAKLVENLPKGIITGVIKDKVTGEVLSNSKLGLYSVDELGVETLVKKTAGNYYGRYIFDEVEPGNYIIKAKTIKSYN